MLSQVYENTCFLSCTSASLARIDFGRKRAVLPCLSVGGPQRWNGNERMLANKTELLPLKQRSKLKLNEPPVFLLNPRCLFCFLFFFFLMKGFVGMRMSLTTVFMKSNVVENWSFENSTALKEESYFVSLWKNSRSVVWAVKKSYSLINNKGAMCLHYFWICMRAAAKHMQEAKLVKQRNRQQEYAASM